MQSDESEHDPVSPGILDALQQEAGEWGATIGLDQFIQCALYHPEHGYYSRERKRVGRSPDADFYTASSLGPVFSKLVIGAIQSLMKAPLSEFTFIEIGPETKGGIIEHLESVPFKECRVIRPGNPVDLPAQCVVFSNELLDAQPFRRFVYQAGKWMEVVVKVGQDGLSSVVQETRNALPDLPESAPEGYLIDWPSGAHDLMESICRSSWNGLFLAFDYGIERTTAFHNRPGGTGRTYFEHKMGSELLEAPGHRDITCHLIWEECQEILSRWQFSDVSVQRQEAFFMHHATEVLNRLVATAPPGFSREKQTLMELLHPDNMGHKFQVLHARRGDF